MLDISTRRSNKTTEKNEEISEFKIKFIDDEMNGLCWWQEVDRLGVFL